MADLTAKQLENLRKIYAQQILLAANPYWGGFSSREIAKILWPDSPAWGRRTRFHAAANNSQGSMGGTMPMLGARRARELNDLGVIAMGQTSHNLPTFRVNSAGVNYLTEHPA